ncbi:FkbM family methyltransferase [Nocardioides piscis]|uniref:FkbM family methyltransferase n=1 Tax=Nocardioides piscis TaxID=2714938 RepID=A0A6G7YGM7_9ACTN|nr:FkbM family methyltransferase [Nocardioides piscis]QIK75953.1 FkbM family methyltransferase [Nocardioides piscis]
MIEERFVSYAQNREDVVLWRALQGIRNGRYVEIGANDPEQDSISKAFYDRGWSGLEVEPEPSFAQRYRAARPRDVVVQAAVTGTGDQVVLHRIQGTGLSTTVDGFGAGHEEGGHHTEDITVRGARLDDLVAEHGFDTGDVHFCMIDVEGAEADVLSTVDLRVWRPWVLVIEATEPNSVRSTRDQWEEGVLAAGYQFCLFDGLSCFYVAEEHAATLADRLSYAAAVSDHYVDARHEDLTKRWEEVAIELGEWRAKALTTWANGIVSTSDVQAYSAQVKSLTEALADAEKTVARQAAQIKALRQRLKKAARAGEGEAVKPTLVGKVARTMSGRRR